MNHSPSEPLPSKELDEAIVAANRQLDEPFADPDDDIRTVARQFLRARESIQTLREDNRRWVNARDMWMDEIARLKRPAHEREPPHCANCSCGIEPPSALDDETLFGIARQFDQGPGETFEFDAATLLRFMRSFAATVEGMVRDRAATEPCPRYPHWRCPHHGDFDARVAVGCPECVREMRNQIRAAQPPGAAQ